jgi:hypothetical protein
MEALTKQEIQRLLSLQTGTKLACKDKTFTLKAYNKRAVPNNNKNEIMHYYPNEPMWTEDEYEQIVYKFMMVDLEESERPMFLKDLEVIS